jgi:hypothetical protein
LSYIALEVWRYWPQELWLPILQQDAKESSPIDEGRGCKCL